MEVPGEKCSVKVAVHIRPLIPEERALGCKECITIAPPRVQVGPHSFVFDHVYSYGDGGSPSQSMFDECAAPLVDGLFQGYNGTILAYGQTGSGKSYTMGTGFKTGRRAGLIPQVMNALFDKMETFRDHTQFQLHVSFIEILREEVRDLLDSVNASKPMAAFGKAAIPGKSPIQIRESSNGFITLAGSTEVPVSTLQQMASCLEKGSLSRATGITNMNNESSRSHAIFTITLEQIRKLHSVSPIDDTPDEDKGKEYLCAKLHLVDLAGSERAKRTGSDVRLKEGINLNEGLLALGNVISALGNEKKIKEGMHVPYRDSKLTRLLQDSLGGNSKTVMIACISPADLNADETLNTLKYANRARNIQNKLVANRDLISHEMHQVRQQLRHLQAQLCAEDGQALAEEVQVLKGRIAWLEATNKKLSEELHEYHSQHAVMEQHEIDAREGYSPISKSDRLKRDIQIMESLYYQISEAISDEAEQECEHTFMQCSMGREVMELNKCLEQKKVLLLHGKAEETVLATKGVLEAQNPSSSDWNGHSSWQGNEISFQRLLDVELDVMVHVHQVRFQYEKQRQEQAAIAEELALLKQMDQLSPDKILHISKSGKSRFPLMTTSARIARIASLEDLLSVSSIKLEAMAAQLSEARERECRLHGRGHWKHLCSIEEAKDVLEYMFNAAVKARCHLWEKEMEIENIKRQLHNLVDLLGTSEVQRKQHVKMHKLREQPVAIALDASVSGNSHSSSNHYAKVMSGALSPVSLPSPKQLKFTPEIVRGSIKKLTSFLEYEREIAPVNQLSINKLVTVGHTGKLWMWKRSHHQRLLQFKWKWKKPWKVSELIKHSDETIMRSRFQSQASISVK